MNTLKKLLLKKKIFDREIDNNVKNYLEFISRRYQWLRYNKKAGFFVPNYELFHKVNPLKCLEFKLKYFYNWKFPPRDKNVKKIKITPLVKKLMEGKVFTKDDYRNSEELRLLRKHGFLDRHSLIYLSSGFNIKFYYYKKDTEVGDLDSFTIFNPTEKEIIVSLKIDKKEFKENLFLTDQETDLREFLKEAYASHKSELLKKEKLRESFKEKITNIHSIKPYKKKDFIVYLIPYNEMFMEFEKKAKVFHLEIRGKGFVEKTAKFPLKH